MKLLFATTNPGKVSELKALIDEQIEVVSLLDYPQIGAPEETGTTFLQNAEAKALFYARATALPSLADDSGLCVDALNGAPGVRSARYVQGTDFDRSRQLLVDMKEVAVGRRKARFRCALCLGLPNGKTLSEEAECLGTIGFEFKGQNGFGYDPIFLLPSGKSMAELTPLQKSAISHRGQAFRLIRPHLALHFFGR